jgi:diaminohydroxyphosphoribosylaminopyrimidine deaminase/5-amino-6-(5-phosphoribosylamino)uracil reductase
VTYYFSGIVLVGAGAGVAEHFADAFGGRLGDVTEPTPCAVIAFAADHDRLDLPDAFEAALVAESANFPGLSILRLESEWFGGLCSEFGRVICDGAVIAEESAEHSVLPQLFAHIGVTMPSQHFEPLTRNWFAGKGAVRAARDSTAMCAALAMASMQRGKTGDNPAVGCFLVGPDGDTLAWSATGDGGRPHAEEMALDEAMDRAEGGTLYVTLEPCAQRSAGGASCADLIIAAKIARVVIATFDPHPLAAGAGIARMKEAGIAVEIGLFEASAQALNAEFLARWGG